MKHTKAVELCELKSPNVTHESNLLGERREFRSFADDVEFGILGVNPPVTEYHGSSMSMGSSPAVVTNAPGEKPRPLAGRHTDSSSECNGRLAKADSLPRFHVSPDGSARSGDVVTIRRQENADDDVAT